MHYDSDASTAAISDVSNSFIGRLTCRPNCVWIGGKQSDARHPLPFGGRRVKPATLLSGDWLIWTDKKVTCPNSP